MFASDAAPAPLPPVRTLCGLLLISLAALLGALFWQMEARERLSLQHSDHLIRTAVKHFSREAEVLVRDYGYWNEAHRNLVQTADAAWVAENIILDDLRDLVGIEAFVVLDQNDKPVFAEGKVGRDGVFWADLAMLMEGGLAELIDRVRGQEVGRPYATSAFIAAQGHVALAAVSPVLPFQEQPQAAIAGKGVHMLVLIRPLSDLRLLEMMQDFGLAALSVGDDPGGKVASLPLLAGDGSEVARLTWTLSRSGEFAFFFVIGFSVVLAILVSGLGYRAMKAWDRCCHARQVAEHREAIAAQSAANFIGHISHDLRRPLSAITGVTQLIKTEVFASFGNPRHRAYLVDVLVAARQLTETISTLLNVSQVEQRSVETEACAVELPALLQDVESMLAFQLKRGGVSLKIEGALSEVSVFGNAMALKQVVLELIANAVRQAPAGGEVTVRVDQVNNDWVEIAFSDQGGWASPENLSVMLRPFAAIPAEDSRDVDLGLAVLHSLVRLQNGSIATMSKPGEGVIIVLRLPRA